MAKRIIGTVSSDVQDKTITVTVVRRKTHPLYKKQYTETSKYVAHDEKNQSKKGDRVEIVETRPISKRKAFILSKIIEVGHAEIELKEDAVTPETEAPVKESKV